MRDDDEHHRRVRPSRLLLFLLLFPLSTPTACDSSDGVNGRGGGATGGEGTGGGTGGWMNCLAAGTRISTPGGFRRIQDLAPGDLVTSFDAETNTVRANPVVAVRQAHRVVGEMRVPGGRLLATEEHPFYDATTGAYREVRELGDTSTLLLLPGPDVPDALVAAGRELVSTPAAPYVANFGEADVYDLTVARDHNYFAEGVLVHNKSGGAPPRNYCYAVDAPVVCSGPATLELEDDTWTLRWDEPTDSAGGAGGQAGGPGEEEPVVVAFATCTLGVSWSLPYTTPFVEPSQRLSVGVSSEGLLCAEVAFEERVADADGRVPVAAGESVHLRVTREDCLYFAHGPIPTACGE